MIVEVYLFMALSFMSLFYSGTGYNVNYGNPEAGYAGNLYPISYGLNPVSFSILYMFYVFVCVVAYLYYLSYINGCE